MRPKVEGPIGKPPTGGSAVQRDKDISLGTYTMKVETNLGEVEAQLKRIEESLQRIDEGLERVKSHEVGEPKRKYHEWAVDYGLQCMDRNGVFLVDQELIDKDMTHDEFMKILPPVKG
jgi:hypothetical protein